MKKSYRKKVIPIAVLTSLLANGLVVPRAAEGLRIYNLPSNILPPKHCGSATYPLRASGGAEGEWSVAKTDGGGFSLSDDGELTVTDGLYGTYAVIRCLTGGESAEETLYFDDTSMTENALVWCSNHWGDEPQNAVDGNPDTAWSVGKHTAGSAAKLCIDTGGRSYNTIKLNYGNPANSSERTVLCSDSVSTGVPSVSGAWGDDVIALDDPKTLYTNSTPCCEFSEYIPVMETSERYLLFSNKIENASAEPFALNEIGVYRTEAGDLEITDAPECIAVSDDAGKTYRIGTLVYDTLGNPLPGCDRRTEWEYTAPDGIELNFDGNAGTITVTDGAESGNITLKATAYAGDVSLVSELEIPVANTKINIYDSDGNEVDKIVAEGEYTAEANDGDGAGTVRFAAYNEDGTLREVADDNGKKASLTLSPNDIAKAFCWDGNNTPLAVARTLYGAPEFEPKGKYEYHPRTAVSAGFAAAKENAVSDTVLLAEDFREMYMFGNRANMKLSPRKIGWVTHVPLECVETLGGSYTKLGSSTAVIRMGSKSVRADVKDLEYIPAETLGELLDMYTFNTENGLVMYSHRATLSETEADAYLELLYYDRPTADEVFDRVEQNGARPRILADAKTFKRVAEEIETDLLVRGWYDELKARADGYLSKPVCEYKIESGRLLNVSVEIYERVSQLAFVYQMTGDTIYADRAWKELKAASDFSDWHPSHFLDVGEMSLAFAVGFDWLHDYLTYEERAELVKTFEAKGLAPYNDCVYKKTNWTKYTSNWNLWIRNGVLSCILSMEEELNEKGAAQYAFEQGMIDAELMINELAPDGAWIEGTAYWDTAVKYLVELIDTLENSTGHYYGYDNLSGFAETAYFSERMTGPGGVFNYADTTVTRDNPALEFWFAARFGDSGLKNLRLNNMSEYNLASTLLDILWYVPDQSSDLPVIANDVCYDRLDIATMRNGWENDALFAGFKGADTSASHYHYDGGNFIFDYGGKRFASELGRDGYAVTPTTNERDLAYKIRAEGHNTLVINPSENPGQRKNAKAHITKYSLDKDERFAVADLTTLYKDNGTNDGFTGLDIKRGFKMSKSSDTLLIQDEVHLTRESELYWFMHTPAAVTISDDGRSAVLKSGDVSVKAEIIGDEEARFSLMDAWKLDTTPDLEGQGKNPKFKKLFIHFDSVKDTTFAVRFSPEESGISGGSIKPLAQW